jgi:hypothetical protein
VAIVAVDTPFAAVAVAVVDTSFAAVAVAIVDGMFRVHPSTYLTKCNEMDRRWKIIIFMTRLFNARKLVEYSLYLELIFQVELGTPLIY